MEQIPNTIFELLVREFYLCDVIQLLCCNVSEILRSFLFIELRDQLE